MTSLPTAPHAQALDEAEAAPVSGARLRAAKIGIVAAGFCSMLNLYAPQAILPTLAEHFAVSPAMIGLTITATTLAVALFGPFSGAVADSFGRKRVIVAALIGLAVPTVWSGLSGSLEMLIVSRFLQGVFMPAAFAASLGYVSDLAGRERIGRLMSLYIASNVCGGFAGRFLGGLVAELADWHSAFFVLAAINLVGAALVAGLLPTPAAIGRRPDLSSSVGRIFSHIRNPRLLVVYFVGFNVLFGLMTVFSYINFHLSAPPFSLTSGQLGLVFCVYLVGIVVTSQAGRLIDRFGQRRSLMLAAIVAIGGLTITLAPVLWAIVPGLAVFCSAVLFCQAAATSQIGLVAGTDRSSAAGLYLSFYYGGGALGAILPGYAWAWGGWPACVALAVAVQVAVMLAAWILFDRWIDGHSPPANLDSRKADQ